MTMIIAIAALLAVNPKQILWSVSISPDGHTIAASGAPTGWLHDATTLAPDGGDDFLPRAQATAVAFRPSGSMVAISGVASATGIADLDARQFAVIPTEEGARGIAFNHDGSRLAISENNGSVSVWSVDPLALLHRHDPPGGRSLTGVAWHPSLDLFVTIGEFITIHDLTGDVPLPPKRIVHRPGSIGPCLLLGVDWHPSGDFFTISDYGHQDGDHPAIQFRDADGRLIRQVERPGSEIRNVRWNRAGDRLAATSDALVLYDLEGRMLSEVAAPADLWGLDWSPDGQSIYTTDQAGHLARWIAEASSRSRFTMSVQKP